jgi:dihydrofolate synthase/folylpolyglutamate synthase
VTVSSPDAGSDLARYRAAVSRLDALIRPAAASRDLSPTAIRARAEFRLDRLRRFLDHLGNPHDAYPIVHVGGTSGKGSTSAAIAAILVAAGYRVGLHTSPYLQVPTEKLQIDGLLIGADAFAGLVEELLALAADWTAAAGGGSMPTYGEISTALALRWFERQRVDVAVVEVGAGGRFDPTNVVKPTVAVVTSVGLDHTATLGATIPEIAWHKAGIIKPGAVAITAVGDPAALGPIEAEVAAAGTVLRRVVPDRTVELLETGAAGTRWRSRPPDGSPGRTRWSPLPGRFQALNGALAVEAVAALAARGFAIPESAIDAGLAAARLPGRFEAMPTPSAPRVVLDGAHNPQKMAALADGLPRLLGLPRGGKPVVVLGSLDGKDVAAMVRLIAPEAVGLVATRPRVLGKAEAAPEEIADAARAAGFAGEVAVEPEPADAIESAMATAARFAAPVLVTGSLYLVGELRERWYPSDDVVRQRTPWPGTGSR